MGFWAWLFAYMGAGVIFYVISYILCDDKEIEDMKKLAILVVILWPLGAVAGCFMVINRFLEGIRVWRIARSKRMEQIRLLREQTEEIRYQEAKAKNAAILARKHSRDIELDEGN